MRTLSRVTRCERLSQALLIKCPGAQQFWCRENFQLLPYSCSTLRCHKIRGVYDSVVVNFENSRYASGRFQKGRTGSDRNSFYRGEEMGLSVTTSLQNPPTGVHAKVLISTRRIEPLCSALRFGIPLKSHSVGQQTCLLCSAAHNLYTFTGFGKASLRRSSLCKVSFDYPQ